MFWSCWGVSILFFIPLHYWRLSSFNNFFVFLFLTSTRKLDFHTVGKYSIEGKVEHKFDMEPHSDNLKDYGKLCRERTNKAMIKTRQVQVCNLQILLFYLWYPWKFLLLYSFEWTIYFFFGSFFAFILLGDW